MDTREKDIEKLKDYKYGFTTDIENIKAPKGRIAKPSWRGLSKH